MISKRRSNLKWRLESLEIILIMFHYVCHVCYVSLLTSIKFSADMSAYVLLIHPFASCLLLYESSFYMRLLRRLLINISVKLPCIVKINASVTLVTYLLFLLNYSGIYLIYVPLYSANVSRDILQSWIPELSLNNSSLGFLSSLVSIVCLYFTITLWYSRQINVG